MLVGIPYILQQAVARVDSGRINSNALLGHYQQIRGTGRAEAVTKEGLAATLQPRLPPGSARSSQDVSPIKWDNVILYGQYVLDRAGVR